MSEMLDLARQQVEAGDCKQAAKTLEKVEVLARYDIEEARGLLEVATTIRDKGGRRERKDCDWLISKAEGIIRSSENAQTSS
jgi:hypothetical protein